jgi:hypothetical protein
MDDSAKVHQLEYEETPLIEPIEEKSLPDPLDTPELSTHMRHGKQSPPRIGKVFFYILLFIVGVAGSTFIRPLLEGISFPAFPSFTQQNTMVNEKLPPKIIPVDATVGWKEYSIRVGTHVLTYRLPATVLPPVCDGQACPSEGTYLEGGSRLTISPKMSGSPIANFAKLIVKDAGGRIFETKETVVSGLTAVDFSGTFTGLTTGGYSFTQMHGVMIQVAPAITVEINHFAPNGITSEFEKDDMVFSEILKTVIVTSSPSATVK